ncbi:Rieske (2Fe-2S) protein [Actinomadura welshii]
MDFCPSRRTCLAGIGGAGVAALLAACGGQGGGAATAEPGQVLATTGEVPVGGGVMAEGLVIVQPAEGTFRAFDAACPHRGARVEAPSGGVIVCPSHNSRFNAADGSLIDGPADEALTEVPVRVDGDGIVRA